MSQEKVLKETCFCWNINYICNYRCPYCYFNNRWDEVIKDDGRFPIEAWLNSWRHIYEIYGRVRIETAGGEPFMFPSFERCIDEVCKLHNFRVTTNLSCPLDTLKSIVNKNSPERLKWNASFHPTFADPDVFLEKVSFLKNNNFEILVMFVAYPPQLEKAQYYKNAFEKIGATFFIQAYQGIYKGLTYPDAYTQEERKTIYGLESDDCGGNLKNLIENQLLKKPTKSKLCLAGYKYAFIDSTGIVYRCSRERKHPMGNFLEQNFKLLNSTFPCEFTDCPCEFIWLVDENKENISLATEVNKINLNNTDSYSLKLSNNSISLENKDEITSACSRYPAPGRVFWCWDIAFSCNYKCSYCHLSEHFSHPSGKSPKLKTSELIKIWSNIYEKYGRCHIHISGGEPSIYPDFFDLISQLSAIHALEFDTNLSFKPQALINRVTAKNVKVNASFHPEYVDFDTFISKVVAIKNGGFQIGMSYVGYPPNLHNLKQYKELCIKNNIDLTIQSFRGVFNEKEYPSSYTDYEKGLISSAAGGVSDGRATKRILEFHDKKLANSGTRLCRMGQMGAKIYPNGDVFRCCYHPVDYNKVGNLFTDPEFKLFEEPRNCNITDCPCWRAMIVGKEPDWQHYWVML